MLGFTDHRHTRITVAIAVLAMTATLFGQEAPRGFEMGFTPWPYDATLEAVEETYRIIQEHGDLLAHHLGAGIPWQEALDGEPYPDAVLAEIEGRTSRTTLPVYLAIEALDSQRVGLARTWGTATNMPLEDPWSERSWDDPAVIEAFINFSLDMIDRFNPRYFNYGVEVSDLLHNNPAGFEDFKVFAARVYAEIKAAHPDLDLMVSVALREPCSQRGTEISRRMHELMPFVDTLGVSVYGYAFFEHQDQGDPSTQPPDWLTQVTAFSRGKPLAITETGWIAQDLDVPAFGLSVEADTDDQQAYVAALLRAADQLDLAFVIWFSAVDYDALWSGILGEDPTAAIWRDTGMFDDGLTARPALETWSQWFQRPRHRFVLPHLATAWQNYLFVDGPASATTHLTLTWFDEAGHTGGSHTLTRTGFARIDLTQLIPDAHAARITTRSPSARFRLAYLEPTAEGVAEFRLDDALTNALVFDLPIFEPEEATLTWKGLALYHDGSEPTAVALAAYDADGTRLAETNVMLNAQQRIRASLDVLFGIETEQARSVVRVTARSPNGKLAGLVISGNGLAQLLFTRAVALGGH